MINMNILNGSWTGVDFDGLDERAWVDNPTSFTSDNTGSVVFWVNFDDLTLANNGFMNLAGMGDTSGSPNQQINFGARRDDALYPTDKKRVSLLSQLAGVGHEVVGSTDLATGTLYCFIFVSNGSAWTIYVNGVAETLTVRLGGGSGNSGRWFSDWTWAGTPRWALGNVFRQNSWAPVSLNGRMYQAFITGEQITASQAVSIYNGGKPRNPSNVLDISQIRSYWTLGGLESGVISTQYDAFGNNNLTSENMENADIVSSNFY